MRWVRDVIYGKEVVIPLKGEKERERAREGEREREQENNDIPTRI